MATDYIAMAGTAVAGLVALAGTVAYFHRTNQGVIEKCEEKLQTRVDEMKAQHATDLARVEKMVDDERNERRRELERVERTVEGFADVASAVVGMGKGMEHIAQRQNDHQEQYRSDMTELKSIIRSVENRLMDSATKKE